MGTAGTLPHPAHRAEPATAKRTRPPECFQSDQRYFCKARCPWSPRCKKLIAEWLR